MASSSSSSVSSSAAAAGAASPFASSSSASAAGFPPGFSPPPLYSFPPFFTLQPTDATRAAQIDEWKRLFLSWAAHTKTTSVVIRQWPHWANPALNRRLPEEGVDAVASALVASGNCEWADGGKTTVRVFYKTPAEWASAIFAQMQRLSYSGQSVVTLYELHSGTPAVGTEFEGLDPETVMRAMRVLQEQGKVDIIPGDVLDETGLRFKV